MIDLHSHSTASDGSHAPAALVRLAEARGLTALALTDHDTVAGIPAFMSVDSALRRIPGVEVSTRRDDSELHVLGLFIDHESPELQRLLQLLVHHRRQRNLRILKRLQDMGLVLDQTALPSAGIVCRTHFADELVRLGACANSQEAFDRFIGRGRPAFAALERPHLRQVTAAIRSAGGLSFWAHPAGLFKRSSAKARKLCRALREQGLDGLECYYSRFTEAYREALLRLARETGMLVTGGSDFHGDAKPGIDLGTGDGSLHVPEEVLARLDRHRPQP